MQLSERYFGINSVYCVLQFKFSNHNIDLKEKKKAKRTRKEKRRTSSLSYRNDISHETAMCASFILMWRRTELKKKNDRKQRWLDNIQNRLFQLTWRLQLVWSEMDKRISLHMYCHCGWCVCVSHIQFNIFYFLFPHSFVAIFFGSMSN